MSAISFFKNKPALSSSFILLLVFACFAVVIFGIKQIIVAFGTSLKKTASISLVLTVLTVGLMTANAETLSSAPATQSQAEPSQTEPSQTEPSQAASTRQSASQAKESLQDLLLSDDYSDSYQNTKWQKKDNNQPQDTDKVSSWLNDFFDWLGGLSEFGASFGVFIKVVALLLLACLLYFLLRYFGGLEILSGRLFGRRATPTVIAHLASPSIDINAGLPDKMTLVQSVQRLIDEAQYLAALSMLYRGTLRELSMSYDLPITHAETEIQCQALLTVARGQFGSELTLFGDLVAMWQEAAYGRRLPSSPKARLTALLQDWQSVYARGGVR